MADGLRVITQADFSAGAFPGYEDVPPNGTEDILNGLIRDDGAIERRGGTVSMATSVNVGESILWAWDGLLGGGRRTVIATESTTDRLQVLDATDAAAVQVASFSTVGDLFSSSPSVVAGIFVAANDTDLVYYGGARTKPAYSTGTASWTRDSQTVTGAGTAWLANIEPGMLLIPVGAAQAFYGVVQSVDSDTQLTLVEAWRGPSASGAYGLALAETRSIPPEASHREGVPLLANVAGRLLVGTGNRVLFSTPGEPAVFADTDYHLLPSGVRGIAALGDAAIVFTDNGAWSITNLAYDLTDDFGNPQQSLQLIAPALILWGRHGIVGWEGGLIIPAMEDIYVLAQGGQRQIGGGILRLYRSYVAAGYVPGRGATFNNHYMLPILSSAGTPIDILVCKLSTGAWSRWSVNATTGPITFAARSVAPPKLIAGGGRSIVDATGTFYPSASVKSDADGTAHQLKVTSRSIMLSETIDHTLRFGRLRYELDDAATDNPTFTAEWSRGRPGSSFTALTGSASEGEDTFTWSLAEAGQQTRMRFTSNNAAAKAIVRAMEFKVRQHGRT